MPETEVGSERHRFCPSCGTEAVGAGSFCSECVNHSSRSRCHLDGAYLGISKAQM